MLIFVQQITPRIEYLFDHIFNTIFSANYSFTTNKEDFLENKNPVKISYGKQFGINEIFLNQQSDVLYENDISPKTFAIFIDVLKEKKKYDPLALCFFLLTRYQEYLPFKTDTHGRFPFSEDKIFEQKNVLQPIVDNFAYLLKNKILALDTTFKITEKKFSKLSTIDIDRTWKYKELDKKELALKSMKALAKLKLEEFYFIQKFIKNKKDPYAIFDYLNTFFKNSIHQNVFFYLMADNANFDHNIAHDNIAQKQLIDSLSTKYKIGIHPSYQSNEKEDLLPIEKLRLENIISKPIYSSRQHYIKLTFPNTYQNLLKNNIRSDYSMGFADHVGFRAGTSHPFKWFDLSVNAITNLTIFPFCMMDVTLKNYMHFKLQKSIHQAKDLIENIEKVNGTFIPIFHNESLSNVGEWAGWRKLFERIFES